MRYNIKSAVFYNRGSNEWYMTAKAIKKLSDYMNNHVFDIFEIDDNMYIFDSVQLSKKIDFSQCIRCKECCCGESFAFDNITYSLMLKHEMDIKQTIMKHDVEYAKMIGTNALFDKSFCSTSEFEMNGENRCSCFISCKDGSTRCAIRLMLADKGMDLYDSHNMSCLLEPLEIIDITMSNNCVYRFVTSIVGLGSQNFSRFYWNDTNPCCNGEGQVVYKAMKNFIINEFGIKIYNRIWSICR